MIKAEETTEKQHSNTQKTHNN